jgi:outer membrane immunogenic protein
LGFANENYSALTVAHGTAFPGIPGTFNPDRWGYTLGAGLEYGLTPNWSAKLEYLHYGFSSATAPVGTLGPRSAVALSSSVDTLKVGINYRFGGPIVAKY